MLDEDENSYYLEFFSRNIVLTLVLSLFLAPVVPGWIAQYFLIAVVVVAGILCVLFAWARSVLMKLAMKTEVNTSVQTLITDEAKTMFRVVGTTALILIVVLTWLAFAKALWVFESFFVLFAGLHIGYAVVSTLLNLVAIRDEINDDLACVYGAQSDLPVEETDGSENL